jgi:GTP-binding protein HflX
MRQQRDQRRGLRKRSRVPVVAIVGYTNAGKSTLLNTVTGSKVDAENKLFATLDPTVRRIRFPHDREIVLLDTVGFIRNLPPALRQAFAATLEEVAEADLLLHMVDAADPDRRDQIEMVEGILGDLGAGRVPRLVVYNKCDALEQAPATTDPLDGPFWISALDRRSTRELMRAVEVHLWERGRIDHAPAEPAEAAEASDAAEASMEAIPVEPDVAAALETDATPTPADDERPAASNEPDLAADVPLREASSAG